MASEKHIDKEFPSGSLVEPPPFNSKTRLVLSDNGVGIFLEFGPEGCSCSALQAITLTPDEVRQLRYGLECALGNLGERT
ncbi:MAG: hypothetical protein WCL71_11615 [Deltaproteobacteria bacterium]